jgi:hypothetical protein
LANLRQQRSNPVGVDWIEGGAPCLVEGIGNVKDAATGVVAGAWAAGADIASGGAAAIHGTYDEIVGDYGDERKQAAKASAVNQRGLARLQAMTSTEEGGFVNSLYKADRLAATGRYDQAVAMLGKIPANELAGLNPSNPNFSKNTASFGVNTFLFAVGTRVQLLRDCHIISIST